MKAGTTISKLKNLHADFFSEVNLGRLIQKLNCSCKMYQTNTLETQTNSVGQIATLEDLIIDSLVASITLKDEVYRKYVS